MAPLLLVLATPPIIVEVGEMGATASNNKVQSGCCFDSNHSSSGVTIDEGSRRVTFPRHIEDLRVVCLNATIKTGSPLLYVRVKINYDEESMPIIGFGMTSKLSTTKPLLFRNFYLFDIVRRRFLVNGEGAPEVTLPPHHSGDTVEFQLDLAHKQLLYNVCGSNSEPLLFQLEGNIATVEELAPVVGVTKTNLNNVSFDVLGVATQHMPFEVPAKFVSSIANSPVLISEDGKTVTRENIACNSCILVDKVIHSGKHYWTFDVIKDVGSSMCFGIAKHPVNIHPKFSNSNIHIYFHEHFKVWRSYGGHLYSQGSQQLHNLAELDWREGKNIEIQFILDMSAGTLEVLRDGELLGVAFDDVQPPVQPVVLFYSACEKKVQLVNFKSVMPPLTPIPVRIPSVEEEGHHACFDSMTLHGHLTLSPDGLTLLRSPRQEGNAYCLLDQVCSKSSNGLYRWSFEVNIDKGASTCLGITTVPVNLPVDGEIFLSNTMYLYRSYGGTLYRQGMELQKHFAPFSDPQTLVELVLDMNNNVLQYFVNGENQGIAFVVRPCSYRPVVAFYAGMEKSITLKKFEHFPSNKSLLASCNNLNKLGSQKSENLLSILGKVDSSSGQSDVCLTCGVKDQNIALLPCKHIIYCADHVYVGEQCIACGQTITGYWNVF